MTGGSRRTQLTTESRRADTGMERRSTTEAESAPISTTAGNKKDAQKTRATSRSGTRRRTRPGAERKTERDATRGTKTRREAERQTSNLTEIQNETKKSKETKAKSDRRKGSITKSPKRRISLERAVTARFVILINFVGLNHKGIPLLIHPFITLHTFVLACYSMQTCSLASEIHVCVFTLCIFVFRLIYQRRRRRNPSQRSSIKQPNLCQQ